MTKEDPNYFKEAPEPLNITSDKPDMCGCVRENGQNIVKCQTPATYVFSGLQEFKRENIIQKRFQKHRNSRSANEEDTDYTDNFDDSDEEFDSGEGAPGKNYTWPTVGGITYEQANATCTSELEQSPAYNKCRDVLSNETLDSMITACILDVQVTPLTPNHCTFQ